MSSWRARVHWGVIDDARARHRRERRLAVAAILAAVAVGAVVWGWSGGAKAPTKPAARTAAAAVGVAEGDFARAFVALTFSAISGNGVWAANGGTIERSNDGGLHWTNITPPNLVGDDPGARVAGFAATGSRDLWFAASEAGDVTPHGLRGFAIEHSTDGGRTWRWTAIACEPNCSPMSLSFLGSQRGWAVANDGYLFTTIDGGTHWSLLAKAPTSRNAMTEAVSFTSETAGWLAASPTLYSTTDGGRNWRKVPLPTATPEGSGIVILGAVRFFGPRVGVVPAVLANGATVIYATSDAGARWNVLLVPASKLSAPAERWTPPVFTGISRSVWSIQSGYGPLADLLVTANGGRSWAHVLPPPTYAEAKPIWKFAMVTPTTGWILASAAPCKGSAKASCGVPILLRTTDAGRRWQTVDRPTS